MLFGSTILELALAMTFVYLLLSFLCSAIVEFIESLAGRRAKDLRKGIAALLANPKLAQDFFDHPLVKPLGKAPSYIPSRTFSLALWNMATSAALQTPPVIAGVTRDIDILRATITRLPDDALPADLKGSFVTLIDEAGGNFEKARENVEKWYDDAMDRVSGRFKRRTHWILLGIGLAASIGMNLDSINIVQTLAHNNDLRQTVVAAAENYAKTPLPTPDPAAAPQTPDAQYAESVKRLDKIRGEINELGLPIGWSSKPLGEDPRGLPEGWGWLLKAIGFILTAMAVSQGAPFWFDLLNKIIVIRSTVKPHEKSPMQPSKDRPAPETRRERKSDDEEESKD
ncbi:MAG: hypothetical protein LC802_05340 [Acidobacteria bacterium]|nr:hypothetical protein [Acidobacteriota bacterium]